MGSQAALKLQPDFEAEVEAASAVALPAEAPAAVTPPTVEVEPVAASRVRLWDWPLRVFHWSLVAAVTTAIVTAKLGGDWMPLHGKAGLTIVGLLAFRVVWGFVGSQPARFASFAPTPRKLLAYVRGTWRGIGHNPLGALSVFALLGLLTVQASTGLFSNDDISFTGPLFNAVDEAVSGRLTGVHRLLANVLYGLLGLHVLAIAFYVRVKKQQLVKPMVTGWKDVAPGTEAPIASARASGWAFVFAALAALTTVYAASGAFIKRNETPAAASIEGADAGTGGPSATPTEAATLATTPAATATPSASASAPTAAPAW